MDAGKARKCRPVFELASPREIQRVVEEPGF